MNDIGRVTFTAFQPLFVDEYRRNQGTGSIVLIDPVSCATPVPE